MFLVPIQRVLSLRDAALQFPQSPFGQLWAQGVEYAQLLFQHHRDFDAVLTVMQQNFPNSALAFTAEAYAPSEDDLGLARSFMKAMGPGQVASNLQRILGYSAERCIAITLKAEAN
jgi:hypothetical protein